jgi:4-hydroxy-tetrahydrodipicolinate synthase
MTAFRPAGIHAAIVTPFQADEWLDEGRLASHIGFMLDSGVSGIVPIGGCGEYVNLSVSERQRVIQLTVLIVNGRVPVTAGALAPSTREVIEMGCFAASAGASALLVLPPYYIRPSLAGIVDHFARVAEATGLPVIAYNNPPRTAYGLDPEAIAEIAAIPGVVGVKDCDRDLASIARKIERAGERLAMLGGDDDLVYWVLLSGAAGAIMATANLAPRLCVGLYEACARSDIPTALAINRKLLQLVHVRQGPDHPGPLKELMAMAGRPVGPVRRPLQSMTDKQRANAAALLAELGEVR